MSTTFIAEGKSWLYANATGVVIPTGAVVVMEATLGVAVANIEDGAAGAVMVSGVHALPKVDAQAQAQGALVYWDAAGTPKGGASGVGALTTESAGNVLAGRVYTAAASDAATVEVLLNA